MSVDLKTLTPDTSIADSAVLFGADSQASTTPSVYSVATLRTHIVGTANTFTQPQVVSVGSSSDALRITQTGAGNALVVEDSANPDATPFVVTADGNVVVGNTTGVPAYGFNNQFSVVSALNSYQLNAAFRNDAFSPILTIAHSRGTTVNAHAVVQNNDDTGILAFAGSDGTQFIRTAQVSSAVDGTPGTNDMPGRLVFSTTADGAASPTERMRITSAGNVGIGTSSPTGGKLHVVGTDGITSLLVAGATRAVRVQTNATGTVIEGVDQTGTGSYQPLIVGGSDVRFTTSNIERMRIDSSGNVGIGTPSPSTPLTVKARSADNVGVRILASPSNVGAILQFTDDPVTAEYGSLIATSTYLLANSSTEFRIQTSGSERMRITSGGDVGIGTGASTPQARLDVAGRIWSTPPAGGLAGMTMYTAAASGFVPGQISFTRASAAGGATPNNSAVGEFRFDGRDANGSYTVFAQISAEMFTNAAGGAPGSMSFFISASGASAQERMRLTSQGLGVGSTSFGASAERVLSIGTGVAPTTGPADTIQIYSTDLSAGNTILSLFTEGAGATNAGITNTTVTNKIAVRINGTVYYLLATTNGT